jgi:hypothetical protein
MRNMTTIVRELMGRVCNVVLINVYLDLGNSGGSGFWATWEQGGRTLSQQGGFQVSREGSKGEQREQEGARGKCALYIIHVLSCI